MAIKIKEKNKGKFTKYAKSKGMSVQSAASTILANKDKYSSTLVKRANFARNARKFKHEEGGLVEYGVGGMIAGAGSVMSAIPTPFTQIAGAAMNFIGGIVNGKEEQKAEEKKIMLESQQRGAALADAGQASIRNPFAATFEKGGQVGKPNYTGMGIGFMNTVHPRNPDSKLANRIYNTVKPDTYSNIGPKAKAFIKNENRFANGQTAYVEGQEDPYSEDGWANYLGLEQKYNTFGKSQYRPSRSTDPTATYYSMPEAFRNKLLSAYQKGDITKGLNNESNLGPGSADDMTNYGRVLGNFTVDEGQDEKGKYISYYDKYDLAPTLPVVGKVKMDKVGKPFEIYDRIYYAAGGVIPNGAPNVEVEGGEVLQGKDKSLALVNGPKHSQGGVQLMMENGGRVFSDKIINPSTGRTFAEDAEILMKQMR